MAKKEEGGKTHQKHLGDSTNEVFTQLGELIKVVLSFICGGLSFNLWTFLPGFILTEFYSTSFILILTYFLCILSLFGISVVPVK